MHTVNCCSVAKNCSNAKLRTVKHVLREPSAEFIAEQVLESHIAHGDTLVLQIKHKMLNRKYNLVTTMKTKYTEITHY